MADTVHDLPKSHKEAQEVLDVNEMSYQHDLCSVLKSLVFIVSCINSGTIITD
ncbi:hypothetical protein [Jeotgalicoccus sp. WY2]|uniref:hypothetical protein n=1 Tax=Jeotgalicoccus sp. WY2 TaxID=2708346 RepID=UPI00353045D9